MKPDRRLERQSLLMPFPALVGQDSLKQALLLLAVNPRLNGLLVGGEKGTGKSTAARGLARLLPAIQVNEGCMFGCRTDRPDTWCDECRANDPHTPAERRPPFETAPLGITEDQLLGTFDLERALKSGEVRFKPGLLARVNHGVLYVDEANLLDDHIVDLLLDCAASGVNVVAREAELIFPPTNQAELVQRAMADLPCGGTTPLSRALGLAHKTLSTALTRDPCLQPSMLLISDGKANVGIRSGYKNMLSEIEILSRELVREPRLNVLFVDTTEKGKNDYPAQWLAERLRAERFVLHQMAETGKDPALEIARALG